MTVKEPPRKQRSRQDNRSEVFTPKPFALARSVAKRLDATDEQMAAFIGVTYRTFQRRAQSGQLEDAESAKVEMIDNLLTLGTRVFGEEEQARRWLTSPILSLEGRKPIELLDTVKGYERAKNKLLQIEYGTF